MIDFSLTEEQEALREMLLKFTQNEIIPVAARYDREGEFAMELVKKAYDLQIMNASVPEAYGGGGMLLCWLEKGVEKSGNLLRRKPPRNC